MKGLIAGLALTLALGLTTGAQADAVKERYDQSCTYCHSSGAAGAPKTGDQAAWKPRLEKGMDTLVKHVKEGYNAMPPGGMCGDCSDEEYRALIEYMSK
ncbi:c-type cytochrome [Alloalcanivorax profundimaris]|uniref:Cytochrome c-type protein n=1 Tax=Alloalcanivorax profundimaris TaxID=2735259 RepID=A0ABS0AVA4_9GAMM|nr:c-type cytochrome [Alloalcanivorax profundimaris]MAO58626.1 cytochrome c5 family protein [Alcanivorax sp.]MBM1142560.1 cytochrome c5 family protein [Alcanivorax sp. ZXX171]MCQ6260521.1 c-type cytochrome [Alcanivorax sp. MM125-6]MAY09478.1 cytochrome c5 family protein [Alcanivorax sp.]MBF1803115.1 cytochrome c5 family protein [Alloalcanivorax profundimaris]|tara:strand:+ start:554 stop:850 length:297 start_codon:yes stop_codon:yes gene_type:complete